LPVPGKRDSDWSYAWIPVVGPVLGAFLAVIVWSVLANFSSHMTGFGN
jgi:glycerol uptake facilitator protein